jgi:hypothetical protein
MVMRLTICWQAVETNVHGGGGKNNNNNNKEEEQQEAGAACPEQV